MGHSWTPDFTCSPMKKTYALDASIQFNFEAEGRVITSLSAVLGGVSGKATPRNPFQVSVNSVDLNCDRFVMQWLDVSLFGGMTSEVINNLLSGRMLELACN